MMSDRVQLPASKPRRRYERGQNRYKHVGRAPEPEIVCIGGEVIGKCPAGRSEEWRQGLVDGAIGMITVEPYSSEFPKRLFTVDSDGTIYSAQTSNPGDSYHGYPYQGSLGKRLLAALEHRATELGCRDSFSKWVKQHITMAGKPDL